MIELWVIREGNRVQDIGWTFVIYGVDSVENVTAYLEKELERSRCPLINCGDCMRLGYRNLVLKCDGFIAKY